MRSALFSRRGFTLFELLVVLVVISLMSAMVIPRLSGYLSTLELKSAAQRVAAVLRYARNKAAADKILVSSEMDVDGRRLTIYTVTAFKALFLSKNDEQGDDSQTMDMVYLLPEGIRFKAGKDNAKHTENSTITLLFFPNGSCNGGTLTLVNENDKQFDLSVDSITGSVTISD